MGALLLSELKKINSQLIKEVRGRGLFVGIEIEKGAGIAVNANHLSSKFLKHGILTKSAREQTLRLTPPLIITEAQVMQVVEVAQEAIGDIERLNYDIMIGFRQDSSP